MRVVQEPIEIGERAEQRIDVAIVGDVIAEVGHGRGIDRRDPDRIDAEPAEIIETPPDAFEVADAVAIAVLKRARIDLIDDAALPPQRLGHRWLVRGFAQRSTSPPSCPALTTRALPRRP